MEKSTLAERRAALLHAGAQVSRNITSILDPDVLLAQTVDIICETFGFYYAGVFLLDETGEWAVLRAGRGEAGAAMIAEEHKLRVGGLSMIGAATGRNKALIALDVGDEPVHFKNPHLPLTRSEMALPLAIGDRVIGALTVQSVEEAAFSEDDITALQAMADQLAVALHNARLYTENARLLAQATRRARLLMAAADVGKGVTSILDLDKLLHRMVDIICEAYGFYYAGVFLLDPTGTWAVLRAGRGEAGAAMVAEGHKLQVGGFSMIGASIAERRARIALDVGAEAVFFKNPHLPLTRSEMALPLVVGAGAQARVIGAVTVQSVEAAAFSDEDISSLQAMADQLAIALNNAHLLRELEAAHAELVRTKTFEAIASATTEAIHWIGNKALPITVSVQRLREDLENLCGVDPDALESIREDLQLIEASARLIVQVKDHLIGPAREYKPAPAMIEDVLKDTVRVVGIPAALIDYAIASDVPLGIVDTTQLSRAFRYVLQNALEATENVAAPHIHVEMAPFEEKGVLYVATRISDNGPGIPEADMQKIWVSFYTTRGAKHPGLGLPACVQILKQIDGKITARNLPEGGVVFELLVPAFVWTEAESAASLPTGKRFLLVDDNDVWSRFIAQVLVEARNTVVRAVGGEINYADFDVIIVDEVLHEADSVALLKGIAKAGAAGKTLVVASSVRVERMMDLLRCGVRDVVLKPYTRGALADKLR
ncbi:MAG TPA: GAF domain-containing protein [Anaerolineae bacterium]|nr:GAF domain-containing protein [Anaerolineae bacterium]HQI86209.1 GAF domain-containing protein [Anaerolineae bacterium]